MTDKQKFTLYVSYVCYYEVDIEANSFEDALLQSEELDQSKIVTTQTPVDSKIDPNNFLISITKQES